MALALFACHAKFRGAEIAASSSRAPSPMRASGESGGSEQLSTPRRPAAEEVAKKIARLRARSTAPSLRPAPPPSAIKAEWLRTVGSYEDPAGREWLLVKNDRSGSVIKLRADGTGGEEGRVIDAKGPVLLVEIDSIRYSLSGR